jgi:hypothetical protein
VYIWFDGLASRFRRDQPVHGRLEAPQPGD